MTNLSENGILLQRFTAPTIFPFHSCINLIACLWNELVLDVYEETFEDPSIRPIRIHKFVEPLLPH